MRKGTGPICLSLFFLTLSLLDQPKTGPFIILLFFMQFYLWRASGWERFKDDPSFVCQIQNHGKKIKQQSVY